MRDFLPPLFDLLTGLAFLLILLVGILARPALKPLHGRLAALSLAAVGLGLQLLARATEATSIGAGGNLFVAAGISFFVGALFVTVGLFLAARAERVPR